MSPEIPMPPEEESNQERLKVFSIGDVVITPDIPLGVVLSQRPGVVNVAGIRIQEDGSELLNPPGTINAHDVSEVVDHWGVERVSRAWSRQFSELGDERMEQISIDFRKKLEQRITE